MSAQKALNLLRSFCMAFFSLALTFLASAASSAALAAASAATRSASALAAASSCSFLWYASTFSLFLRSLWTHRQLDNLATL